MEFQYSQICDGYPVLANIHLQGYISDLLYQPLIGTTNHEYLRFTGDQPQDGTLGDQPAQRA